jgi:transcription-repair coupling factor (superfamily II helicase)
MIFDVLGKSWANGDLEAVLEAFAAGKQVSVSGLKGSSRSFYFFSLQRQLQMPLVIVTTSAKQAEELHSDLGFLDRSYGSSATEARILLFPENDTEPYQGVSPHPQISVSRMQALWHLRQGTAQFVITSVRAATQFIAPPENFSRSFIRIEWGEEKSPLEIAALLRNYGYREKDLVTSAGEFSLRGGILDFYSPAEETPIRMEFFGNRIESMRSFETSTQRSIREVEASTILSLREMLLTQKELDVWADVSATRWASDYHHEELTDKTEQLLELGYFEGYEEFVKAFFPQPAHLFSYVPDSSCIVLDEPINLEQHYERELKEYRSRFEQVHEHYRLAMEPEEIFESWEAFYLSASRHFLLLLSELMSEPTVNGRLFQYAFQSVRQYNGHIQEIVNDVLRLNENEFTQFFVLPTPGKAERLTEILKEYQAPVVFFQDPREEAGSTADLLGKMIICIGDLTHGFRNPEDRIALFTEDDLFGELRPVAQTGTRKAAGTFLADLRDLKIDDYVVHVDHGIGQFVGLNTMYMEGQEKEFLLLRFADDDKLYVPVERLDLVQKYMGAGDAPPRLDKLGSNLWQKTKSRAKASMKEMAEKLLQLYAYRKAAKGYSFRPDDVMQREFEDAFEFQETAHQQAAIEDLKADMESDKPADRLICGDVGYGKTEVAMRAAFKAVNDGKQVAVLAPTTILAFQHYHTFRKRFEMFPITIEMVSRFRSRAENKKILEQTQEGKIDILIGTHRLLSKDVHFQDLGLMIIDEEQRFGVAHKEKLKELKKNIDAVSLTATPIPRTLQMALMGFRPLSVIETPPKDRLAIQTNIVKYSEDTIGAAIRAELKRGGQVYFVHNRVETIHSTAAMVKRLIPEARVAVAHGQMDESDLEKVMLQFIDHEYDVLVSTTIIENGIDIPLVNTLIVNRADRFGLSQLYQLRGRVGRSHRRAYAYFLIPSEKELTPIARKRLTALREFTDLGSGFRLAALDLEIRGAGNLLGSEQHGHIAALGFELYCRMLEQTVKELQGEEVSEEFATNINLNLDIRIPEDYIPNMNQRLNLYKRIATAGSEDQIGRIRDEMTDRFGPIPYGVENLLEYGLVRLKAENLKIRSVDRSDGTLFFQLSRDGKVSGESILAFIQNHKGAAISPAGVLSYPGEKLHLPEVLFKTLNHLLDELSLTTRELRHEASRN